jgi:hypothetical protein
MCSMATLMNMVSFILDGSNLHGYTVMIEISNIINPAVTIAIDHRALDRYR